MLKRIAQFRDLSIDSLHTGGSLGATGRTLINPNNLSVVGFFLAEDERRILLTDDIREANASQVIVDSEDVIAETSDLLRLKEILDIDYQLEGKKVQTKSGNKLGVVRDCIVDDVSWKIQKLHIKQPILKNFTTGTLIIDRRQVLEVHEQMLIVEDTLLRERSLATHQVS